MSHVPRQAYAEMYGPTVGDRVRLADTGLFIEVAADRTLYGEEVKFGGGKVIRDSMGQSLLGRAEGAMDTVITNALILDHWAPSRPMSGFAAAASRPSARRAIPTSSRASTSSLGPASPGSFLRPGAGSVMAPGDGVFRPL